MGPREIDDGARLLVRMPQTVAVAILAMAVAVISILGPPADAASVVLDPHAQAP